MAEITRTGKPGGMLEGKGQMGKNMVRYPGNRTFSMFVTAAAFLLVQATNDVDFSHFPDGVYAEQLSSGAPGCSNHSARFFRLEAGTPGENETGAAIIRSGRLELGLSEDVVHYEIRELSVSLLSEPDGDRRVYQIDAGRYQGGGLGGVVSGQLMLLFVEEGDGSLVPNTAVFIHASGMDVFISPAHGENNLPAWQDGEAVRPFTYCGPAEP